MIESDETFSSIWSVNSKPVVKFLNMYDGEDGKAEYRAATSLVNNGAQVELKSHVGYPDFLHPESIDKIEKVDLKSKFLGMKK